MRSATRVVKVNAARVHCSVKKTQKHTFFRRWEPRLEMARSFVDHLSSMAFPASSRALLLCVGLTLSSLATTQSALAAGVKITEEARKHFNAGVALLRDPDGARYEEAYREFKVAYQASPSWKILGNLGLAAMKLERDGEAIAAFERYLKEGGKELDAAERADIERDLNTLRSSAVTLTLTTNPADLTITDERVPVQGTPIRNRYQSQGGTLKVVVRPGHHVISAVSDGKPTRTWELDAEPGTSLQHHFDLDAAEQPATVTPVAAAAPNSAAATAPAPAKRPVPTSVWIGAAATGALAIGAGVTGVLALGKNSDYQQANGVDAEAAESLKSETDTLNLVTDILIAAAVVSAGVTTYLYIKRPERQTMGTELRLAPAVGLQTATLRLEGTFR